MQSGSSYGAYVSHYGSLPKTGCADGAFDTWLCQSLKLWQSCLQSAYFFWWLQKHFCYYNSRQYFHLQ